MCNTFISFENKILPKTVAIMRHALLLLSISFTIFSCNDDKVEKDVSIAPLTTSTTVADTTTATTVSSVNNLPVQMPANGSSVMPQSNSTMPQNVVSTSTTTAPGMNPPHGQPGHRCDIKDGAPLSSAPARVATQPTGTTPQIVSAPQPATNAAVAAPTVTQKGMNPAHGQPGHRCDISVGAPLNSAPTAKPATTNATANITPMATPTQNLPVVPALQNTSITTPAAKTSAAFTGKVNPAHGQPGHDCKVAVGQPLP
jgi:hypothetical protein